ncbi:hypothetical protein [Dubosiella newyorkensis]|uniref:hypothetical protein n=1 Tax=Dubosiella newyorkensis TaxID=1862672 RepID=UPI00259CBCC6|nr:hypothetical protein [Dubosiella newyorkensis]
MNYSFLDALADKYVQSQKETIKEYDEFYSKHIQPLIKQGDLMPELEEDVTAIQAAQESKSFKDGFKACMQMMLECTSKKAVKS